MKELSIELPERINYRTITGLREKILDLILLSDQEALLDFNRVEHLDSVGIGLIVMMCKRAREENKRLKIINCDVKIAKILMLANFYKIINIELKKLF